MKKFKIILVILTFICSPFIVVTPILAQNCTDVVGGPGGHCCNPSACPSGNVISGVTGCYGGTICCSIPCAGPGEKPLGQVGGGEGFGPWGDLGSLSISEAALALTTVISNVIGIMTIIAGIWFIFQFMIGALGLMGAAGDPKKIEGATAKIRTAVIGLVIVVAAYALMSLLGKVLGFEFLKPITLIEKLGP